MQVSDIRLNLLKTDSGVKAIGSISLDGEFAIRGIRVMEDKHGRNFVAFPSREKSDGTYEDIAFPLNKELYHEITESIINEYQKLQEEKTVKSEEKDDTPLKDEEETQAPKKKGR